MTIDQALHEMELVGHDFFLFQCADTGQPTVVYRRHAYDYGLIRLTDMPLNGAEPARRAPGVAAPGLTGRGGRGAGPPDPAAPGRPRRCAWCVPPRSAPRGSVAGQPPEEHCVAPVPSRYTRHRRTSLPG